MYIQIIKFDSWVPYAKNDQNIVFFTTLTKIVTHVNVGIFLQLSFDSSPVTW